MPDGTLPLMTMQTPADPRTRFETAGTDLGDALDTFGRAYDGSGFVGSRTERPFSYRFRVVGDQTMSFRSTLFDARAAGEAGTDDEYVVMWTSQGGGTITAGGEEVSYAPGTPVVFPTEGSFRFELQDVRESLVHFDRGYLEGIAAELGQTGPGPLVFDHAQTPRAEDLRAWNAQVRRAAQTVLGSAPVSPIAMAETARDTALAMLRTFPHRQLAPTAPVPEGASSRVREAIEFLHAFAHTPITTTDVAEHVGLSVRGLQQAFQRQVGTAPNAMLRGVRMDRVREELQRGTPGETTVAEVAVRWGFAHLGRFSAAYAKRFGEYPRETLGH